MYCFLWSCEIWHWKSDRYCIILWIDCGSKVTFTGLILSTQEHKLIFHCLVSFVIPFSHILMSFVVEVFYYFSTGDTVHPIGSFKYNILWSINGEFDFFSSYFCPFMFFSCLTAIANASSILRKNRGKRMSFFHSCLQRKWSQFVSI